MQKHDLHRIQHMLAAIQEALSFVKDKSRFHLDQNRMLVLSLLKEIEIIGEAAGRMTPEFADLVLLVNPAIEGARYIPIYDLVTSAAFQARTTKQLPVFICAQADNDQPVGLVFPLGNAGHAIDEATIGDLEKECVNHALGFVPSFRTHALAGPNGDKPFVLTPPGSVEPNPFWVVGAAKEVIDGHGGIWQTPFLQFIASLVFQHVQASKKGPSGAAAASAGGEPSGDLAEFAKSIGPIKVPQP